MRTLRTVHDEPQHETRSEYREIGSLPSTIADMLGLADLESLTITKRDGVTITYSAIEYRCLDCGEYGHATADCPEREIVQHVGEITVTVAYHVLGGFCYSLAAHGPDHGVIWEFESPDAWQCSETALSAGVADAERRQRAQIEHDIATHGEPLSSDDYAVRDAQWATETATRLVP